MIGSAAVGSVTAARAAASVAAVGVGVVAAATRGLSRSASVALLVESSLRSVVNRFRAMCNSAIHASHQAHIGFSGECSKESSSWCS